MNRLGTRTLLFAVACTSFTGAAEPAAKDSASPAIASHPAMRPGPKFSGRPLGPGPARFVDAAKGDDAAAGTVAAPWKTLAYAQRRLKPGDTLYLRGGIYYEKVSLNCSGTAEAPITIRSYPGETAVVDGGLREFYESPAESWEPYAGGAAGEYVSTRTYFAATERRDPHQFLPGNHEPLWGIEEERPMALGNFADSMVPLHGYRIPADLRSTNELWIGGKSEMRDIGFYGGPGLWLSRDTGRIHIRLAHHRLAGLGDRAYRGETDPRKLPLIVAAGFGEDVLRLIGVRHVRLEDLVLRGATGSPMINIYGSQQIALDHLTIYGGFPALLINASKDVRVAHSALRSLAAPWTSRAHMKYRGTGSYQIVLQNNQPRNENIELAHCEFTDGHDFGFFRYVNNLKFHHNLVDNFNDDGLECGPKLRDHTFYIYQNRISRCLIPLSQHEFDKDESPADHEPGTGVYLYRNVFDLRDGTYKGPPGEPDPSGKYLHEEGHVAGDHGSPTWPVMYWYHNTLLRTNPTFRDYFLFGLGAAGLQRTERDVFNNIFVQFEKVPGAGFAGIKDAGGLREGGNLLWGASADPNTAAAGFTKFRASPLFEASRKHYEAGWTTHDLLADPRFKGPLSRPDAQVDLRLEPGSPAVDAGIALSTKWPDPLREEDAGKPDIGALPLGAEAWGVGVEGRMKLFGE